MRNRLPHRPKGSMCASCLHRYRNCSGLDFGVMPVMYRQGGFQVVKCSEYEHGSPPKLASDIDSVEHQKHADGFIAAMVDRIATYKPDPAPKIHRTPVPCDETLWGWVG